MAAPSYTTDLTTYGSVTSTTGWAEATGMTATDGTGIVDSDLAIYGTQCYSESQRKSGLGSLVYTGTAPTWTSGWAYFIWYKFFAPNSLATKASGGIRVLIGSSSANYRGWYVNGSDTYATGGWKNYAVDPEQTGLATQTQGSPTTTYNTLGFGANLVNGISKGNSHTVDIMRYGRGEARFTDGDLANGYATFAGWAAVDDNQTTGRYGLFSDQGGSYLWKGLMSLGLTATSVDMRDANVSISIDNTEYVATDFNRIEVHNSGSNVEWDSVNIKSLSTRAPGEFEMIDNATVVLNSCTFQDMSTFVFLSNGALTGSRFLGCGQITHGGADFFGCIFSGYEGTAGTSYLSYNVTTNPNGLLDACSFTKGTAATHAIGFTQYIATMTLTDIEFSGYSGTIGNNDTALYFADTGADRTWTVNLSGCTGTIQYTKARAGDTVNLIADQITHTLVNLVNGSEVTYMARGTAVDTGSDGATTASSRNFVTTNAWTTDAYKGHLLYITSGSDAGRYYVSGNNATTLFLDTALTTTASSLTWELYDENDDTEEFHVESVTGNQTTYTYTYTADIDVDIAIINVNYEEITLEGITLGNADQTIPISQRLDENYFNP